MSEETPLYEKQVLKQEEHKVMCFKAKVLEKESEKPKIEPCIIGLDECKYGCGGLCRQTC